MQCEIHFSDSQKLGLVLTVILHLPLQSLSPESWVLILFYFILHLFLQPKVRCVLLVIFGAGSSYLASLKTQEFLFYSFHASFYQDPLISGSLIPHVSRAAELQHNFNIAA